MTAGKSVQHEFIDELEWKFIKQRVANGPQNFFMSAGIPLLSSSPQTRIAPAIDASHQIHHLGTHLSLPQRNWVTLFRNIIFAWGTFITALKQVSRQLQYLLIVGCSISTIQPSKVVIDASFSHVYEAELYQ